VPGINQETPEHWIEISRELARERGIDSGRWVEITSRRGKLRTKVLVTERVSGNEIYVPLHPAHRRLSGYRVMAPSSCCWNGLLGMFDFSN
jgi:predicted molibdopterin-dependent oxidoreductase YjgC